MKKWKKALAIIICAFSISGIALTSNINSISANNNAVRLDWHRVEVSAGQNTARGVAQATNLNNTAGVTAVVRLYQINPNGTRVFF